MQTAQRGKSARPPADFTGTRDRALRAQAERDRAARELTAADLARIQAHERAEGYREGVRDGLDIAAASLLSLAEDELLARRREYAETFAAAAGHEADDDQAAGHGEVA